MKKKTKKTLEESTVVCTNPNLDANITTIVENNNSAFTDYEVGPTIENAIDSKLTMVKNKINTKILKNKTVGVKFWYDGIPDKKNPSYNDILKRIPHYAYDGDIGMDLTATSVEYDIKHDRYIYHTGFYAEAGREDGCFILPRSSNTKTEAYLPNSIGLIDTFTYRGEFLVVYKNRTSFEQLLLNTMIDTWLSLPWYKKIFTNYTEWFNRNIDKNRKRLLSKIIQYAPYEVGDKLAQIVWMKFPSVNMTRLKSKDKLSKTERGENGFGSTNNKR